MEAPTAPARAIRAHRGFTLVEILVVVVILGILAAIVVPQYANASEDSRQAAFVTNMRTHISNAEYFVAESGQDIGDTSSGQLPNNGFEDYVEPNMWTRPTPIGGVWDTESGRIGVHFDGTGETRDDAYMTQIDRIFDDGDLNSGSFQQFGGGRYYYVLSVP